MPDASAIRWLCFVVLLPAACSPAPSSGDRAPHAAPVDGTAAPAVATRHSAPAQPRGGAATPPAPGRDLPARTTARSGADATHTLPDVPVQRALRVGAQPGADRLVFEFDGDGLPAWSIEYVERPVYDCGSGEVVRLPGGATGDPSPVLQVRFIGAQAHTSEGEGTTGPRRRDVAMKNLLALARTCDFEGEVTWVAAVRHPGGYVPRVLGAPARLVVDIAH